MASESSSENKMPYRVSSTVVWLGIAAAQVAPTKVVVASFHDRYRSSYCSGNGSANLNGLRCTSNSQQPRASIAYASMAHNCIGGEVIPRAHGVATFTGRRKPFCVCWSRRVGATCRHFAGFDDFDGGTGEVSPKSATIDDENQKQTSGNSTGTMGRTEPMLGTTTETFKRRSGILPGTDKITLLLSTPQVEVALSLLVLLSSTLVAVGTLPKFPAALYEILNPFESAITLVFATEFLLRWYSAGQLLPQYLTRPLAVVDLIVVILPLFLNRFAILIMDRGTTGWEMFSFVPSWMMSSSALINLRLLRILRLQRVLTDLETFANFQLALGQNPSDIKPYQLQLARVILNIFTSLSVTAGLIYTFEHGVNPLITDYFAALYFTLITLTTVGFGDIAPVTGAGRLIVCLSILGGVAIIPAQLANLVEALLDFQEEKNLARRQVQDGSIFSGSARWSERRNGRLSSKAIDNGRLDIQKEQSRRFCMICGAGYHHDEAKFCWKCGAKALKDVPYEILMDR